MARMISQSLRQECPDDTQPITSIRPWVRRSGHVSDDADSKLLTNVNKSEVSDVLFEDGRAHVEE